MKGFGQKIFFKIAAYCLRVEIASPGSGDVSGNLRARYHLWIRVQVIFASIIAYDCSVEVRRVVKNCDESYAWSCSGCCKGVR